MSILKYIDLVLTIKFNKFVKSRSFIGNGNWPHIVYDGKRFMMSIEFIGKNFAVPGESIEANVQLFNPACHFDKLVVGKVVNIFSAVEEIGTGKVKEIGSLYDRTKLKAFTIIKDHLRKNPDVTLNFDLADLSYEMGVENDFYFYCFSRTDKYLFFLNDDLEKPTWGVYLVESKKSVPVNKFDDFKKYL